MDLQTHNLRLRYAREADLDAMHAILCHPKAMRFWSTPPHADRAQTQEWLSSMIAIEPELGEDFVVEFEGRVIGKAGLYRFPEIGFIFHPDYWGRGLAREALEAVLERAFEVYRLERVIADVDPRNAASLGLLSRLGFQETSRKSRTWLIADQWCDSVYLSLSRHDLEISRR
jgi:RimJ/RimL family protein N-acetyltransferase